MRKSIECRLKRSALVAAVLAAFLFAAGCGGGVDDPKKKINEGQDKTGTGQTDSSGSGEQQQQQSQEPSEGPGDGKTPETQTPSTPPVETEEVEVQVISIANDTSDGNYAKVDSYAGSNGKKLKVNLTKGSTEDARFGEAKGQLETKLESAVGGAVKLFKDDGASAEAAKTNLTAKKFYFGKEITEKEVELQIVTISAASDDGLCEKVASGYDDGDAVKVKVKISKAAYNNSDTKVIAEAILMKLPAVMKAKLTKDCLVYKETAGKNQLTNKDTDQLKKDGTGKIYFGTKKDGVTAVKVKFTIQSIAPTSGDTVTINSKAVKKITVTDLTATEEGDRKLGELFGREVAETKVSDEIKALLKKHIVDNTDNITAGQNKFRLFKKANPGDSDVITGFGKDDFVGKEIFVGIQTES